MRKIVLITGSTDGIGLATAKSYLALGHTVIIHGRNAKKIAAAKQELIHIAAENDQLDDVQADLSVLSEVRNLAKKITEKYKKIDVLINNAGVFITPETVSKEGLDTRFVVNTIAPYLLAQLLMPIMDANGRIINLSSAAQAPIQPDELTKPSSLSDSEVYAKSKLAITMWSFQLAQQIGDKGPAIIAVNPKSFLGSKMVQQAYGTEGSSLQVGADVLVMAGLSEEFSMATGRYYDNDIEQFTAPHPDALSSDKTTKLMSVIDQIISNHT